MARKSRHEDNEKFGAKRYDAIRKWRTDLFALVDDDDETAWRKSGARTNRRRFSANPQRMVGSTEQKQRAKKKLQEQTKDIIQQLGLESHVSSEAAMRIADKVRREKLNSDQQIATLASGQMPSGVPSWLEHEIRKFKSNQDYQLLCAHPAALKALMAMAPNSVFAQLAARMGFIPEAPRDWVQEFLAADKRDRALAAEAGTKNVLRPVPMSDLYLDRMKHIPGALGPDLNTGLSREAWTAMRMGLALQNAFAAQTHDMHGLMNPTLRADAAQKIFSTAPVTRPFADAEMSLPQTKVLYSKLHMRGMDDGHIARSAHFAVALTQMQKDFEKKAHEGHGTDKMAIAGRAGDVKLTSLSRADADFHKAVFNTLAKEAKSANQNDPLKSAPPPKIAKHVVANAEVLGKGITSATALSTHSESKMQRTAALIHFDPNNSKTAFVGSPGSNKSKIQRANALISSFDSGNLKLHRAAALIAPNSGGPAPPAAASANPSHPIANIKAKRAAAIISPDSGGPVPPASPSQPILNAKAKRADALIPPPPANAKARRADALIPPSSLGGPAPSLAAPGSLAEPAASAKLLRAAALLPTTSGGPALPLAAPGSPSNPAVSAKKLRTANIVNPHTSGAKTSTRTAAPTLG